MERWLRSRMAAQDAAGHKTRIALRNASSNAPGRYPGSRVPGTLSFREHPAACGAFPGDDHPVAALPLAPRRPLRGQRRLGLDLEGLDAPASRLTRPSCEGRAPVARRKSISACACRPIHCFVYRFVCGVARVQADSESESSTWNCGLRSRGSLALVGPFDYETPDTWVCIGSAEAPKHLARLNVGATRRAAPVTEPRPGGVRERPGWWLPLRPGRRLQAHGHTPGPGPHARTQAEANAGTVAFALAHVPE